MLTKVYAVATTVTNPLGANITSIGSLAGFVINIMLGLGWALTFIMLAGGFIKYILSKGETKATDGAREWLTYAAFGGVGLFFITVLKNIVINLLGSGTTIPGGDTTFSPFN